jgi:hypothetical protein
MDPLIIGEAYSDLLVCPSRSSGPMHRGIHIHPHRHCPSSPSRSPSCDHNKYIMSNPTIDSGRSHASSDNLTEVAEKDRLSIIWMRDGGRLRWTGDRTEGRENSAADQEVWKVLEEKLGLVTATTEEQLKKECWTVGNEINSFAGSVGSDLRVTRLVRAVQPTSTSQSTQGSLRTEVACLSILK